MERYELTVFFSCSSEKSDRKVVDYFRAICEGLRMKCTNVHRAASRPPSGEAEKIMADCDVLIAIATKKVKRHDGKYDMPPSVQVEMGIGRGLSKSMLLFVEKDVVVEGLAKSMVTYAYFERDKLFDVEFMKDVIHTISEFREEVLCGGQNLGVYAAAEYYSDLSDVLIELKKQEGGYTWTYSGTRRLVFIQAPKHPIPLCAWAGVPTKNVDEHRRLKWKYHINDASRKFRLKTRTEMESAMAVRVLLDIAPTPKPGDYIVLAQHHESPYLNPIYREDIATNIPYLTLGSRKYLVGDGVLLTINTKKVKLMYRFPVEYGLEEDSFVPCVGTMVGSSILHVIRAEIERMKYDITSFGGEIVAALEIDNPMLLLEYGLAWNPPKRK